jgi:hypothetical protein
MLWLYEMSEDGEPCDDFPAINYRLSIFGEMERRPLKPHELPAGYRIDGNGRPEIPGVVWMQRWSFVGGPQERWEAHRVSLGPKQITYSICRDRKHIHIEERREGNRRIAKLLGTSECNTTHNEHMCRIAIELEDLPDTTRAVIASLAPKGILKRLLAAIGI